MKKKREAQLVIEVMETSLLVVYRAKGRRRRVKVLSKKSLPGNSGAAGQSDGWVLAVRSKVRKSGDRLEGTLTAQVDI